MVDRRPLVLVNGELRQQPVGDSLLGGWPLYIQADQPTAPGPWGWVKTGVNPPELWCEDGQVG